MWYLLEKFELSEDLEKHGDRGVLKLCQDARRWTAAEKAEVVLESLTTSIPVSELCRKYQLSSSQFYTWRERFIQAGKSGLGGARPRPQKSLDPVVSSLARLAAERYPTYGYRRLAAVVSKDAEKPVNRKKMRRIMAELNLLQEQPKRRLHLIRSREPQTATVPNRSWQGEMTKVWCGADGWGYLFTVVDTCTREWVGYAFSPFCRAKEALRSVEMAVQRKFPLSWKAEGVTLRTDNGPHSVYRTLLRGKPESAGDRTRTDAVQNIRGYRGR